MSLSPQDSRPGLAVIASCTTPYRINLHNLIAAGIPELKLHTMISHGAAEFDWKVKIQPEIHLTHFGNPGDSPLASTFHAPLREWAKGGQMLKYIQENDIRAVICTGYRYISYLRTLRNCHNNRLPLFVRSDSNIRSEPQLSFVKRFLKRKIYTWWIKRASGIMSMGEYGDLFFKKYGADPQSFYRVPYVPNYEFYADIDAAQLKRFSETHRLRDGRKYFLYSGRLVAVKRVDLLLKAFVAIADQRPNWDLLIAGDGVLRDSLKQLVPKSLQQRVIWTGFLDQEESVLSYQAADALVLPSEREPWALVIQEAMAAGLAIVSSDVVGATRELVDDKISGRVFLKGDVESLREAMKDVSDERAIDRYQEESIAALANWRSELDPVAEIRRALVDTNVLQTR